MEGKNHMARILYSMIIITISVILFIQCGPDSDTVATVGSLEITVDEYTKMLKQRYPQMENFKNIDEKKKRDILDQAIQKKLKFNAALDIDLDEDPEIVETVRKQEENLLGQKYYEVEVVDKLISEDEIKEMIQKQAYELKATNIVIGYKGSRLPRKRTLEEAREIANKVLDEAAKGKDFHDLVIQYSDDPSAKKNKGETGIFRWGQKPDEYIEACWDLELGEISDIIETQMGLYIIRLDSKKKDPAYVEKYDHETMFRMKKMLYGAVADSGKKMWEQNVIELKENQNYVFDDNAVNNISQLLTEMTKNSNLKIDDFNDEDKEIALATWDNGEITFNTILNRYSSNLDRVLRALRDPKKLKRETENLSLISMAVLKAKGMGLDKEEPIEANLNQLREDRMSYLVEQRLVNDKISFTDEDVKKYYEENPDQFMDPEKREMWEIILKDQATAKKVADLAKKGRDFEKLAKKYSTSKYYKDKGGYLGLRTINSRGVLSKKAFEMEPNGKISDPIKYKKEWAVIKTGKVQERKLRLFKDVAKMVEGRLRNDLLKNRRIEWNEELKDKYSVKINEEALNSI